MHTFFCHNLAKVTNYEKVERRTKNGQSLKPTLSSFQVKIWELNCVAHCKVLFRSTVLSTKIISTERTNLSFLWVFYWGPIFWLIMQHSLAAWLAISSWFSHLRDHIKTFSFLFLFHLPHHMWASPRQESCWIFLWISGQYLANSTNSGYILNCINKS